VINYLLGAPGGGKSYEATAFHILPAVKKGRKVITNLPLKLEAWADLDPDYLSLIEIRTKTLATPPDSLGFVPINRVPAFARFVSQNPPEFSNHAFSHVEDYQDEWRHPVTGVGPLYVIDECHKPLPFKRTDIEVDEWFAEHRHYNCDVLLITQSYGKVSKPITDLVQIVYRVRKAVAFGSMNKYIRKVQDGIGGDVVNTSVREYKSKYQQLYTSHTHGHSVEEIGANDIVPIWRRWPFIGAALCLLIVIGMLSSGKVESPLAQGQRIAASKQQAQNPVSSSSQSQYQPVNASASPPPPPPPPADPDPFAGRGIHYRGYAASGDKVFHYFALSQNGQYLTTIKDKDLIDAGYTVKILGTCSAVLTFHGKVRTAICDVPQVGPSPGGGTTSGNTSAST